MEDSLADGNEAELSSFPVQCQTGWVLVANE